MDLIGCFLLGLIIGFGLSYYFKFHRSEDAPVFKFENVSQFATKKRKIKPRINDDKAAWLAENGRQT